MMEQFRREEEEARGGDDDADSIEEEEDVVKAADGSGPLPPDRVPIILDKEDIAIPTETVSHESISQPAVSASSQPDSSLGTLQPKTSDTASTLDQPSVTTSTSLLVGKTPSSDAVEGSSIQLASSAIPEPLNEQGSKGNAQEQKVNSTAVASQHPQIPPPPQNSTVISPSPDLGSHTARKGSSTHLSGPDATPSPPNNAHVKASNDNVAASPSTVSQPRSSPTQPNTAAPSTQESFFKSIHKRLQYLEANSTLSLQYIEEQSRILRDAFVKVEKKQLAKTEKFLEYMNTTVISELKHYRTLYEQLWQSTVIEIEGMKERQRSEMGEVGARLSLMADELVWQKRMAVVQSTLLLLCLGLVLFARSGTMGTAADMPIVQHLGTKYSSFFDSPPPQRGPETGIDRRRRTFKNMWRSDTSAGLSDRSGHEGRGISIISDMDSDDARSPVQIEYSPPTPTTPDARFRDAPETEYSPPDFNGTADMNGDVGLATPRNVPDINPEDQAKRIQVLATQSGPATPNGTRDSRPSWEEVDRAIDQLKAEEQDQAVPQKEVRVQGKARSPLRRAQSNYDGTADDNSLCNSGSELFASS